MRVNSGHLMLDPLGLNLSSTMYQIHNLELVIYLSVLQFLH